MERITGIGGFFFRSSDPAALRAWYEEALGLPPPPADYDEPAWIQQEGETVFAPLDPDSAMPGSAERSWAMTFRVDDLDAMVTQVRAFGTDVEVDPEEYPNGRFAWAEDPEGNRIQLWEPK